MLHSALKGLKEELRSSAYDRSDEDCIDDLLQNIVSVLADLQDWEHADDDEEVTSSNADLIIIASSILLESSHMKATSSVVNQAWLSGWMMIASEILNHASGVNLSPTRIHVTTTMASLHMSNTDAFISTCIILSCYSLKTFASSTLVKHKKRWQSIILETLRGFQLNIHSLGGSNSQHLFCSCILPAICATHCKLQQEVQDNDDIRIFAMKLHAAVVHCSAALAMSHSTNRSKVYSSIADFGFEDPIRYLAEHCWRQHHRAIILQSTKVGEDTALLTKLTTFNEDSSDDEQEDDLIGLETVWPDKGIAFLLTSECCFETRPSVWSTIYQWRVFFPYIAEVMRDELELQSNKADSEGNRMCGLLDRLLQQLPRHVLTSPRCDECPDHPFPVFQWLVNAMVQGSRAVGVKTPSIYYQLMNTLVSRYHPESQLYLIARRVYPTCPYLAMKPKIIDLLRNHAHWDESKIALRQRLWKFVESSLLDEENRGQEEELVALLGLYDVAPPMNAMDVLNRVDEALSDEKLGLPLVTFTIRRIKDRLPNLV